MVLRCIPKADFGRLESLRLLNRVTLAAAHVSPNPLAYLGRFGAQPRLVAGWLFALMRSCGGWVFVVYVGIYGVQQGLGDQVGGTVTSLVSVGALFSPLMLAWMQRHSVRHAVRTGFLMSGGMFLLAALFSAWPWVVLQFSPVAGVFAAAGLALLGAWWVAGQLHPQLGVPGAQRVRG